MPYDQELNERINKIVSGWKGTSSKKMFGGVCHLLNGNMLGGVNTDRLILRLGVEAAGKALVQEHVVPFDITGKPMKGWVMVEKQGFRTDDQLREWLKMARKFVVTLPSK
jgi:TfoX/Sxy family transcriptional regulator of competence genes